VKKEKERITVSARIKKLVLELGEEADRI